MMKQTKEIAALLNLMDDPDKEVYYSVSKKILSFGKEVVPNLENLWETTDNNLTQERAEMLIHILHTSEVKKELMDWANNNPSDLIEALCIFNRYHFPDADTTIIIQKIEKLRRNIWLELNSYLTPLEQINVLTGFLFNFCSFKNEAIDYKKPGDFLLSKLLESKSGNAFILAILLQILATLNDISLHIIQIPNQFILGYIRQFPTSIASVKNNIPIYVDGGSGQIYSHQHIETYFQKNNIENALHYFTPLSNQQLMAWLIEEYANCFTTDEARYKYTELMDLANDIRKTSL